MTESTDPRTTALAFTGDPSPSAPYGRALNTLTEVATALRNGETIRPDLRLAELLADEAWRNGQAGLKFVGGALVVVDPEFLLDEVEVEIHRERWKITTGPQVAQEARAMFLAAAEHAENPEQAAMFRRVARPKRDSVLNQAYNDLTGDGGPERAQEVLARVWDTAQAAVRQQIADDITRGQS